MKLPAPLFWLAAAIAAAAACSTTDAPAPAAASTAGDASTDDGASSGDGGSGESSASGTPHDLTAELETLRKAHGIPALAGAAWVDGTLVARGATGVRKLGSEAAVTSQDKWHLGSCTKAMTATLVGMFVDEGKLSWTDTLPALLADATVHASFSAVTIEMLLQHRGGFPTNDAPAIWDDMWLSAEKGEAPQTTRKRVVYATLASAAPVAVGTFEYSNSGFVAAGVVLERIAGKPWEELLRERIFTPLGMTGCGFGPPATPPATVDQPWGHEESSSSLAPVPPDVHGDNPASLGPAGTVHCPLEDWGKFLNEHLVGLKGQSKLASKATFERLHTPPANGDYAAGWNIASRPWGGGLVLNHSGSNTLNFATTWIAPAKGLVLVAATNAATEGAELAVDEAFAPMLDRIGK